MLVTTMTLAATLLNSPDMQAMRTPKLQITDVEQIDNLDGGDALGANRADFFARVTINGEEHSTPVEAKDDAEPYWTIPLDLTQRYNRITIEMWDDDGGWERGDDHVDINPMTDKKDLSFTYDRWTGKLWGDVDGMLNQKIWSEGKGDDDKARIGFAVVK